MAKEKEGIVVNSSILYIIIPCYNEEAVLPLTYSRFLQKLMDLIQVKKISNESRILFVNDGSIDKTWEIISGLSKGYELIRGVSLSRNRGHQNALLAGLLEARKYADITISIDCDGQDDINIMEQMIDQYLAGNEIVYGVRSVRDTDTFLKRSSAQCYYKLLNKMGAEVIYNHADYRLLSSKVLKYLEEYEEVNLFLRGLIPLIGFSHTCVYYERYERVAGDTHYPIKKMMKLAIDGVTSFSVKPIRIITGVGISVATISFIIILWTLIQYFADNTVSGWASTVAIISFFSGMQLISLGVIGEYIGKIYLETKHRPRYIISERTWECEEYTS